MKTHFDIDRIKQIPIADVAERLGKVVRRGSTLLTACPWHSDEHPSLEVDGKRGNFCHCYSCGHSGGVIDFVMAKRNVDFVGACEWLGEEFGVEKVEDCSCNSCSSKGSSGSKGSRSSSDKKHMNDRELSEYISRALSPAKKDSCTNNNDMYFKMDFINQHLSLESSFQKCLFQIFPRRVVEIFSHMYLLGLYDGLGNPDDVMFPSIDEHMRVHDIKVQHYDCNPQSPNFFHCDRKHIYWLSSILNKNKDYSAFELPDTPQGGSPTRGSGVGDSCLFGAHLLPYNPNMPVALVESPKNAVVGACACQDYVWVASGNKNNLTPQSLESLRGRDVLVFPDHDALDEWKQKLSNYHSLANFVFSSFCIDDLDGLGPKGDIADWIIQDKLSRK